MTGEHLSVDIREFLRLLAHHNVRYLIVGGEAVVLHGYSRFTDDVDFYYERSLENATRLFAALRDFWGEPVPALANAEDLLVPDLILQYGRRPNRIDLLSSLGSVDFEEAWRARIVEHLDDGGEHTPVHFIGLGHLLQAKRDAGRAKDRDDIEHLTPEDHGDDR